MREGQLLTKPCGLLSSRSSTVVAGNDRKTSTTYVLTRNKYRYYELNEHFLIELFSTNV